MELVENTYLQSGKYRIIRVLGQGGFGITYLAEHTMLGKKVAIKEFFPKQYCDRNETTSHVTIGTSNNLGIVDTLRTKFVKEARNISKLNHPHIISIYDIFQENETAYYVMEYVDGVSLAQMVKDKGPMSESEAVGYILKIADAVGYMHSLSMNHLDLKPSNIMVRKNDDEPILIDFGGSKQYDASGGQTSTTPVGISHGYAPIEQYKPGGVATFTPQTDIYALGVTLFNLLTGSVPPHYSEILEEGLPLLPASVSHSIAKAIEHAMEIKKNKRPASIAEYVLELSPDSTRPVNLDAKEEKTIKPSSVIHSQPQVSPAKIAATPTPDETKLISDNPSCLNESDDYEKIIIDGIEFVDLGLSVKWANMNIGANSIEEAGHFFKKSQDGNLNSLYQWNTNLATVPTIDNFKELIDGCKWY